MESAFWLERWENNQIGFHKNEFNINLTQNLKLLNLKENAHIFVPLAGKTLDIIWLLKQGFKVTAIELSQIAIESFFSENNIEYFLTHEDGFKRYACQNLNFIECDIFNVDFNRFDKIDAIYDRAAAVALPTNMRKDYFELIKKINAPTLLVTLEYDQSIYEGPPFSVQEVEVKNSFEDQCEVKIISEIETDNKPKSFSDNDSMREKVYIINNK